MNHSGVIAQGPEKAKTLRWYRITTTGTLDLVGVRTISKREDAASEWGSIAGIPAFIAVHVHPFTVKG